MLGYDTDTPVFLIHRDARRWTLLKIHSVFNTVNIFSSFFFFLLLLFFFFFLKRLSETLWPANR